MPRRIGGRDGLRFVACPGGGYHRTAEQVGFPSQPAWFRGNRDFAALAKGLRDAGFDEGGARKVMGENWLDFFERSFDPAP